MILEIDKIQFHHISQSDDVSNLARMAKEIWEEHYTPIIGKDQVDYMVEKFQSESAIRRQVKENYMYFSVSLNHQPIGYLGYLEKNEENTLFLSKIYLKKPFRRMGYGKQMIQFVIEQASHLNFKSIPDFISFFNCTCFWSIHQNRKWWIFKR